jgi:hypothetical protein
MMKMILSLLFQGVIPMFLGLGGGQYNQQARNAAAASSQAAGQYGSNATTEGSQLNPFFAQEMRAQHSLDPTQANELLTAAEAGSGGTFGGVEGEMKANAARTGNATTLNKDLAQLARDKSKTAAATSEGIAAQDVAGAQALRQQGAAGLQGLYGTNVNAQLGAMKQNAEDIKTEQATQGQNWLQQLDQIAKFGGDVMGDVTEAGKISKMFQGNQS